MRFCATSDVHNLWDELRLEPADVLLLAGDLTEGSWADFRRMLDFLSKLDYEHKVVIGGNHDEWFEHGVAQKVLKHQFSEAGVTYLFHEPMTLTVNGHVVKLFGSPYVPRFSNMAFERDEMVLERLYSDIPDRLDLLVTHGPPLGVLDQNHMGKKCGSSALAKAVADKKPKVHVFGHIHEGYGALLGENGVSLNVAACGMDDRLEVFVNPPVIFDLYEDGTGFIHNTMEFF